MYHVLSRSINKINYRFYRSIPVGGERFNINTWRRRRNFRGWQKSQC